MVKSIIDDSNYCYICRRYKTIKRIGTERHHCIFGTGKRKLADQDGLTVMLCNQCHRLLHDKGLHALDLQQVAEQAYINYYKSSIPEFIQRYGKNYL